jgi:methylated-DNA-[protein]-cysteine S-methyltransferase
MKSKEKEVYLLLKRIPRGKVTTYGDIARKLNINPRQVGRILSRNEHPIEFPCYKVVRSDGNLGGYTIKGKNNRDTLKIKARKLLEDEVKVNNGRVDKAFFYSFR